MQNLVIVESPAKAKTIEKILGKDYTVKSSYGHIRDLKKKGISIDIANRFAPEYEIPTDKAKVVSELKKLSKESENVWLASDEDREGEAIAWHLYNVLGLKEENTRRIVFHEITPKAIKEAVANPRKIDQNLVGAQQARRILDRLVGFRLSPVLWRKVKPSLSAGRVQSVTVRLIADREEEIRNFKQTAYYRVTATLVNSHGEPFEAELQKKFATAEEAMSFLKRLAASKSLQVDSINVTPGKRSPAPTFTTSTLQQEASRKLGFSVSQTMSLAQKLYEAGHITYMRTDSVNLSSFALAASAEEIKKLYGDEYHKMRQYTTKSKGAQEAHEAIRPTHFEKQEAGETLQEKKLYSLIWKRTVASQMADAKLSKTSVGISIIQDNGEKADEKFVAQGEVIVFDGFLKLYIASDNDEEKEEKEGILPVLTEGEIIGRTKVTATERFTNHPARYSEDSLVKKMEEIGIGRPSTYAPTISTIIARNYVIKDNREGTPRNYKVLTLTGNSIKQTEKTEKTGAEKKKLFPTDMGIVVTEFLKENFPRIMDYGFTASVENEFDEIAEGKLSWQDMIEKFYGPFEKDVNHAETESDYARSERLLGKEPATGKDVIARIGRFGPMVQIGPSEDKRYAKIPADKLIGTITLEEALALFTLPRIVGQYEGKDMKIGVGRFGPYVNHNGIFTSLDKTDDPMTVTAERCIELIEQKREKERNRHISTFEKEGIEVLNGRWGPYITFDGNNYKIPKDRDAKTLTAAECQKIIKEQEGTVTKKKTAKKR